MNAYTPTSPEVPAAVGAALAAVLFAGLALTRRPGPMARGLAWLVMIAATATVERLCADEPAGVRMAAILVTMLWGMKSVVAVESAARLSPLRYVAFAALWPGMRPTVFAGLGGRALAGGGGMIRMGLARVAAGAALVALARVIWVQTGSPWAATVPLLVGISLILHFGLFSIAAGLWRYGGADTRPLFHAPLRSTSLTEFWGRRWNLAFSEMTAAAIHRPLSRRFGTEAGVFGSFLASGILHEMAISVPVGAGFGLPTAYFALHGLLVLFEGRRHRAGRPIDASPWLGRVWAFAWVVLPMPLLFHPPFLAGVVWPIIGA